MNASKLLAGAVVAVAVIGTLGGPAHAQSTGGGASPSGGGMPRSEMGQNQNPGTTTPSTSPNNRSNSTTDSTMQRMDDTSPNSRNQNSPTDSTMQRLDNPNPNSRNSGTNSTDTGTGSNSGSSSGVDTGGRDTQSDRSLSISKRRPKTDRN